MSAVKAAAAHIDWTKLSTSLGLKTETVAALSAFRKRNEEARRVLSDVKEQKTAVDFSHYRKVLKNQAVIDEVEKSFKAFKPTSYDVQAQIKSIETVEAKAVRLLFLVLSIHSHLSSSRFISHLIICPLVVSNPQQHFSTHSLPCKEHQRQLESTNSAHQQHRQTKSSRLRHTRVQVDDDRFQEQLLPT